MMDSRRIGNRIIVHLDEGEDFCTKLRELISDEDIRFALVSGHGTLANVRLCTYVPDKYEYFENYYYGVYDLAALSGEIGSSDGEPWLDLAATIANVRLYDDYNIMGDNLTDREPGVVYGGRLVSAEVRTSCVLALECLELDAHMADYMPPERAKDGKLKSMFKKLTNSEAGKLPDKRMEFD